MNMPKWIMTLALAAAATLANAENLILNSTMELGDKDQPTPGFNLKIYQVKRQELVSKPDHKYLTRTICEKDGGKCMMIPPFPGVSRFFIQTEDMNIKQDGEAELSLDVKIGKTVDGKKPNVKFFIDFRTLGDSSVKSEPNWSHPNYPIITGLSGRPTNQWQHFSRRVKVIKWNNVYQFYLWVHSDKAFEDINAPFYVDNLKVTLIPGRKDTGEEAAMISDRPEACYFLKDSIRLNVNALLNHAHDMEVCIQETSFPFRKRSYPLKLKQTSRADKQDTLKRFTGNLDLVAERFGAYTCTLMRRGAPIRSVGRINVIHRPVRHPRLTPGWSIGFNSHDFVAYNELYSKISQIATLGTPNSLRQLGDFAQLTGFKNARIWCRWFYVEQEKGKFDPTTVDSALKPFAHTDVEPFMIIAAGAGMSFKDCGPKGDRARYPHYLYPNLTPPRKTYHGMVRLLSEKNLEDFKRYLDFCLKTWGKDIRIWELFNEPGVLDMDTNVYLKFMRVAYDMVKKQVRDSIFLGNGNTCDVGYDKGWCRRLTATDPNYTDHLDAIAFHPYYNATDYQKNIYNLYSKHIAELRASMNAKKQLFNTECFYITNARQPQIDFYMQKGRCTAEAIQRHVLDGMLNDVKMAASPDQAFMFFHGTTATGHRTLSEAAVAINALSAHLKDMANLTPVKLNPFMKAGVFTSADGTRALGFVYDMRPSGSQTAGPFPPAVAITDLFGNPVDTRKNIQVSYEPIFLKGTPKDVRQCLNTMSFLPNRCCRIYAQNVNDRIYLTALNLTGQPGVMKADFNQMLPDVIFDFPPNANDTTVNLPAPQQLKGNSLPFQVILQQDRMPGGTVQFMPTRRCAELPDKQRLAEEFTLSRGTKITCWNDGQNLRINGTVLAPNIEPAPNDNLWEGDAIEVFIDPAPLAQPDKNQIISSNPLDCYQFIVAAKTSRSGKDLIAISRQNPTFKTKASFARKLGKQGYELDIKIPWDEIRPAYGNLLGLEIEIARPHEKDWKESLSNARKPAYAERHHYPLFTVKLPPAVANGTFSHQDFGDPDVWMLAPQSKYATIQAVPPDKDSPACMIFKTRKLVPNNHAQKIWQTIHVPPQANEAVISVLAEMPSCTLPIPEYYRWRPYGFFISWDKDDMSNERNTGYDKPFPWTLFQYRVKLDGKTGNIPLSLGTRKALGTLKVAEVNVTFTTKGTQQKHD